MAVLDPPQVARDVNQYASFPSCACRQAYLVSSRTGPYNDWARQCPKPIFGAISMNNQSDKIEVKNNQGAHRFEAQVDGGMAVAAYELSGRDIVFTHTEVPEQSRGEGVGD
ncbi:MAG: GNAT family N-acetyltransferase, partial [Gemmatimonadaceae bacterium]